jgi:hypothetical protein
LKHPLGKGINILGTFLWVHSLLGKGNVSCKNIHIPTYFFQKPFKTMNGPDESGGVDGVEPQVNCGKAVAVDVGDSVVECMLPPAKAAWERLEAAKVAGVAAAEAASALIESERARDSMMSEEAEKKSAMEDVEAKLAHAESEGGGATAAGVQAEHPQQGSLTEERDVRANNLPLLAVENPILLVENPVLVVTCVGWLLWRTLFFFVLVARCREPYSPLSSILFSPCSHRPPLSATTGCKSRAERMPQGP